MSPMKNSLLFSLYFVATLCILKAQPAVMGVDCDSLSVSATLGRLGNQCYVDITLNQIWTTGQGACRYNYPFGFAVELIGGPTICTAPITNFTAGSTIWSPTQSTYNIVGLKWLGRLGQDDCSGNSTVWHYALWSESTCEGFSLWFRLAISLLRSRNSMPMAKCVYEIFRLPYPIIQ